MQNNVCLDIALAITQDVQDFEDWASVVPLRRRDGYKVKVSRLTSASTPVKKIFYLAIYRWLKFVCRRCDDVKFHLATQRQTSHCSLSPCSVYSRTRRHAVPANSDAKPQIDNLTGYTPEQLEIMSAGFDAPSDSSHKPGLFRRIPKEVRWGVQKFWWNVGVF